MIESASHLSNIEQPEGFNEALLEFRGRPTQKTDSARNALHVTPIPHFGV